MKIKLIDQNTKEEIGQINLDYIPRIKEFIEFENHTYGIYNIVHSESEIKLKLINTDFENDLIIAEWD